MSDERSTENEDFLAEDYRFTAELLRSYCNIKSDLFQAVCSNNLSIILAALDKAGIEKEMRA